MAHYATAHARFFISRFSSEWQGIVLGAVLVAAVAIDSLMNRKRVG